MKNRLRGCRRVRWIAVRQGRFPTPHANSEKQTEEAFKKLSIEETRTKKVNKKLEAEQARTKEALKKLEAAYEAEELQRRRAEWDFLQAQRAIE